jgi:excisionase family DNA binding protein
MSSNIEVQRICQHCGKDFTARTTTTLYCSKVCNSRHYKATVKAGKIETSNKETQRLRNQPIEALKAKAFLTVREVALLLNCSLRSAYRQISTGNIKAVNWGQRITRVKRSEIDKLFEQPLPHPTPKQETQTDFSKCYNLTEVQNKYGISEKALHELIKRNSIPKMKKGWFAYVPKKAIDQLFK